jgi:hypothetical protein
MQIIINVIPIAFPKDNRMRRRNRMISTTGCSIDGSDATSVMVLHTMLPDYFYIITG